MKRRDKPKKPKYVDDGHTVYSMENLTGEKPKGEKPQLTGKERRAAIRAALAYYLRSRRP